MLASFDYRVLAHVNAGLNGVATVLILAGIWAIKRRRESLHRNLMLTAAVVSMLFLISYLTYHLNGQEVRFTGQGWIRPCYFFVLISHVVLAAVVPVLVLLTIYYGLKDQRQRHRRMARWTAPIWLYVSVTGVLVYYLLYHYPYPA